MRRLGIKRLLPLLLLVCGAAWAQPSDAPTTIFPSDGRDPKQAGGAELLEAVCPGRVATGKEIRCRIVCPKFTGFAGEDFGWSLARVTRGHFLSPSSEDAVLSMEGCEPHSENFGGTILLTQRSQRWTMLWYKAGVEMTQCHKMQLRNGREILVCLSGSGAQGTNAVALQVEDLLSPAPSGMAGRSDFFVVVDSTLTCGADLLDDTASHPVTRAYLEKVEFRADTRGGSPAISVTAAYGTRPMTQEDVQACFDERNPKKPHRGLNFLPSTKSYRVDFLWDGHDYKPTLGSAAAAQILARP